MSAFKPQINLRSKKIALILATFILLLVIAQIFGLVMKFVFDHGRLFGLIPLFDFNAEQNIPTLFSTLLLIVSSLSFFLLWYVQRDEEKKSWIWLMFTVIFIFLACDEFCEIHENLSEPFHLLFDTKGLLYYAWVIPYGLAAIFILIFAFPLWLKMPNRIKVYSALAAFLFLMGAVGMEMLGGQRFEMLGDQLDLGCGILATIEETMEMAGLVLLIYSLFRLIEEKYGGILIKVPARDFSNSGH